MADMKPKFDPNLPFEVVGQSAQKPKFDPNLPFEVVGEKKTQEFMPEILNEESDIGSVDRIAVKNFGGSVEDQIDFLKKRNLL